MCPPIFCTFVVNLCILGSTSGNFEGKPYGPSSSSEVQKRRWEFFLYHGIGYNFGRSIMPRNGKTENRDGYVEIPTMQKIYNFRRMHPK